MRTSFEISFWIIDFSGTIFCVLNNLLFIASPENNSNSSLTTNDGTFNNYYLNNFSNIDVSAEQSVLTINKTGYTQTTNNTLNSNIINNYQVKINPLGQEDLTSLTTS